MLKERMCKDQEHTEVLCGHCGHRIRISPSHAGKQGRCPVCKEFVRVPVQDVPVAKCPFDDSLLDLTPETNPNETEMAYEQMLLSQGGRLREPEERPVRKLPWIVDIFLYPLSTPGLTVLALAVGIPFVLRCLTKFFLLTTTIFPAALVFLVACIFIHWSALLLLLLYMNWYVGACICDSAEGGIRAPDTIATAPSLPDILMQSFRMLVCALAVFAPALFYLERIRTVDPFFWTLSTLGVVMLPMAILAVVTHESLRGLNPILLVISVLKTLFRYLPLTLFCYLPCFTLVATGYILIKHWPWGYPLLLLSYYQMLLFAHLLGCFYKHTEEKLYWSV